LSEDGAAEFFDADGDGDADLFVAGGGYEFEEKDPLLQGRLYLNDGKGHFTKAEGALPAWPISAGCVRAADIDGDGDMDLFIGGRVIPGKYPLAPGSKILLNDGKGHFTDIAATLNPDIAHIGMVTSALWSDLAGAGHPQLLIAGEWMAPRLFDFKKDHFVEISTDLQRLHGWWQTATAADLNGDGLPDLILGNIGENFYLCPDSTHPVKLWVSDFDQNGIKDKVLSRTVDGKDRPVFLKHDMEIQLPSLKKQNLKHAAYAKRTMQDLLSPGMLDSAQVNIFDFPSSIIAINKGNGHFTIRRLPARVQLSSVNAIACTDLDGDGHPDLLLGGNEFGFLPQFGRLDASCGHLLLGDGKGGFSWTSPDTSGLQLKGQIRSITVIPGRQQNYLLFLQNDEYPALYTFKTPGKK